MDNTHSPSFIQKLKTLFRLRDKKPSSEDSTSKKSLNIESLLAQVLELKNVPIKTIMVPRTDIIWFNANATFADVVAIAERTPYTRFPVCRGKLDNVLGITTASQIMAKSFHKDTFTLKTQLKKPLFVSPSMNCIDLLLSMIQKNHYLALVVDEYGGIDGLITLRDLMQEVVGDFDEALTNSNDPSYITLPDDTILADGRLPIEDVESLLGIRFFADDNNPPEVETLAGLTTFLAGHVPKRGAVIPHDSGLELEVVEADPRKVKRLKIHPVSSSSDLSATTHES